MTKEESENNLDRSITEENREANFFNPQAAELYIRQRHNSCETEDTKTTRTLRLRYVNFSK